MKKNKQNKNQESKAIKILNSIIIVILSLVLVASVSGFFILNGILETSQKLNTEMLEGVEPTVIYDSNGEVIIELSTEDGIRENIEYDQIPQSVIDAFLAIEDSRFFKHNGFDLPRFVKAMLENIRAMNFAQGGSTLTMQMIDVTHMKQLESETDTALDRVFMKIQEIFLSIDADSQLSKEEIMIRYLNYINFGGPVRGIQKGAEYYFGKDVTELTLSESAFLAGVINRPNWNNPYYNYENAVVRRNETLDLMLYHGYITQEEHDLAANTELAFQLNGATVFETSPYLSYIDFVKKEVEELTGLNMYNGNMEIYTSMDRGAQDLADAMLSGTGGINYPENDELFQTGFALMDNQNGEILALGGGRGYDGNSRSSRAFEWAHQSGSSIKPIMDYALTFDYLGWATDHILLDAPMYYRNTNIPLGNADGQFRGDINYQYAVAVSLNTTAITALQQLVDKLGVPFIVEHMQKLGYGAFENLLPENFQLTMGIGGGDMYTTPLEMAGAFSIFANEGNYIKPHTIRKIVYKDHSQEDLIPTYDEINVISPQAAYLMSVLLEDAVSTNWQNLLQIMISPYAVYGKTGTSDYAKDGLQYGIPETAMKDKWMVNYTSKYTTAAWAGYDAPVAGHNTYIDTHKMLLNVPGQINRKLFDYIHANNFPEPIKNPGGISSITHIKGAFDNGYFAVPEGTPEELISTGFVKSEFAELKQLTPDELSELESFEAEYDEDERIFKFNFTPYPDSEALLPFEGKYNGVPDFPDFGGPKIFDPRAVFGEIVYKVDVTSNNVTLGSYTYSSENSSEKIAVSPKQTIEVCGYYGFKNNPATSNKICQTLKIKNHKPNDDDKDEPSNPDSPLGPGDVEKPDEKPDPTPIEPGEPEGPSDPTDE